MNRSTLAAVAIIAVIAIGGLSAYYFLGTGGTLSPTSSNTASTTTTSSSAAPSEPFKVKAGDSFPFAEQFFLVEMAGQDKGYYKNNYVQPEFSSFRGSSRLYEAVAAGQVNIGYGICSDVIAYRTMGVPVKVLATYVTGNPWRVLVKGDSPLQSAKDLSGKRVGTSGVRGIDHLLGVLIENKYGIKMEFVPMGGVPEMLAGIKSGSIDAFIQTPGPTQGLVEAGQLKVLVETDNAVPKPWPTFCVWATDDMIKNNGDAVSRFVKATLESVQYAQTNPDYTTSLYVKRTNASQTIAGKVVGDIQWQPSGVISEEGVNNIIAADKQGGDISANSTVRAQEVYTNQFITKP
ncbi:MAG: ABC transporter substrate-binding protein [Thaumarchaeota archaeon]|nr:ABC transporter substrate-binding protein [Nitrososphaerota archaeon]MCL5317861.1 ABC transporter substrate-binding protein [Nitrososphaerota archaeon]